MFAPCSLVDTQRRFSGAYWCRQWASLELLTAVRTRRKSHLHVRRRENSESLQVSELYNKFIHFVPCVFICLPLCLFVSFSVLFVPALYSLCVCVCVCCFTSITVVLLVLTAACFCVPWTWLKRCLVFLMLNVKVYVKGILMVWTGFNFVWAQWRGFKMAIGNHHVSLKGEYCKQQNYCRGSW
jgi:hypothetical protein